MSKTVKKAPQKKIEFKYSIETFITTFLTSYFLVSIFNLLMHLDDEIYYNSLDFLQADEAFVNAARNSDRETAQQQCNMSLMMIIARMLNENTEFCRNYLDNPDFMNFINQRVFNTAYENANK